MKWRERMGRRGEGSSGGVARDGGSVSAAVSG